MIARELARPRDRKGDYCMVGFRVGNTMTENGSVARGVCSTDDGLLSSVVERTAIGIAMTFFISRSTDSLLREAMNLP